MRIGEIIETTSTGFVAESFELNRPPPLGSLVVVRVPADGGQDESVHVDLYAVVTYGHTLGLDPSRRAVRRSTDAVFDQAVYQHHPELEHTLHTEFTAALVGFSDGALVQQHLPAQPPPLHFSVQEPSTDEVRRFTERFNYLRLIATPSATAGYGAGAGQVSPLHVLAANVRQVYRQRGQDQPWLEEAARQIAILLKNDYEALLTVLYAIEPSEPRHGAQEG